MNTVLVLLATVLYLAKASVLPIEIPAQAEIPDFSSLNIESLINQTIDNLSLEFLKDEDALQSLGIDLKNIDPDIIQDAFLLVPDLVRKYGYPAEVHRLQTTDGYILEMHRIPGSPSSPPRAGKRVVFLMHGLIDSSATWVIMRPTHGLGYMLADLGYDVWMGNARGNRYSRNHVSNDPDGWRGNRRRFWAFSWHEIGIIDLPNMIDYVTRVTGQNRMHYIGHSQGTTSFFVMGSERPEYNSRIISMHALAPVAFMSNLRNPFIRATVLFLNTLDLATSVLGVYEFLPNSEIMALLGQAACRDEAFSQIICTNVIFLVGGFNSAQMNTTMIPVIMGHTPAGASTDQLIHYGQGVRSGRFRQYDHGPVSNLVIHGRITPPPYTLSNIRAPVALHYSLNDWLAEPVDVAELHRGLPNVIGKFLVPDSRFTHLDFVWAIDVRRLLYNRVAEIMAIYDQRE